MMKRKVGMDLEGRSRRAIMEAQKGELTSQENRHNLLLHQDYVHKMTRIFLDSAYAKDI